MKLLTNEQQKSYENPKTCHICKEKFENKHAKHKKYRKAIDHCQVDIEVNIEVLHIAYLIQYIEITITFHNGSSYSYCQVDIQMNIEVLHLA